MLVMTTTGRVFEDVSAAGLYLFVRGGEVIVAFADGPIDDRLRTALKNCGITNAENIILGVFKCQI